MEEVALVVADYARIPAGLQTALRLGAGGGVLTHSRSIEEHLTESALRERASGHRRAAGAAIKAAFGGGAGRSHARVETDSRPLE